MTRYQELLNMLETKGVTKTMKIAKRCMPNILNVPAEDQKKLDRITIRECLEMNIKTDVELNNAVRDAANELLLDKLLADLDLTSDADVELSYEEKLATLLTFGLFGNL